ncbi:MAG: hydroxymyristoyl-ACP dehydratase [Planctomycetota bacterium]|nr:MAG: hydroxymyristoyl-ACP dehydratase [Planctomycetota bacterium]
MRAAFAFSPQLEVFAGHFPDRPLVPGVWLLEAVRYACARARGADLRLARVRSAKFVAELRPGDVARLRATVEEDGTCRARLHRGDEVVARFRIAFAEEAACTASS